jgi:hypothetical protein
MMERCGKNPDRVKHLSGLVSFSPSQGSTIPIFLWWLSSPLCRNECKPLLPKDSSYIPASTRTLPNNSLPHRSSNFGGTVS